MRERNEKRDGLMTGVALVIVAGCCWGTSGTMQAFAPPGATAMTIGAARAVGSALVLLAMVAATGRLRKFFSPPWPLIPVFISGFGLALYQLAFFAAARRTGAGVAAVVAIGSSPAIAGVMGYLFFHERLTPKWFVSTALAVGGGALLVGGGLEGTASIDATGVALALVAGLAYALEGVGVRIVGNTRTPLETTTAIFLASGILTLPFLLTTNAAWLFSARGATVATLLAVVSSALPFCLFTRGVLAVGVARSYTLTLSEPLTACLLSIFVLDQKLTATALVGVAVICGAIALLATDIRDAAET